MKTNRLLDNAEFWLVRQFLGPGVPFIYTDNSECIRFELKKRIFDDIRHHIKSANLKPPIDLKEIAKVRKVVAIIDDPGLVSREACLVPVDGGFLIKLKLQVPEIKKRCNCAHEIGHTYFYDLNKNPPEKSYLNSRYWVEEGYVWEIAREIIAPEPYLSDFVVTHNLSLSINALVKLSRYFKVSYGLLGKRLLHDAHSLINKEFWNENAWEGIIAVSFLSNNKYGILKKPKVYIYRSPQYKYRLTDLTSKKLDKAFENKDDVTEPVKEIAQRISDGFISNTGGIQKNTFLKGQYFIEVGKVNKRCVLSVIYKI